MGKRTILIVVCIGILIFITGCPSTFKEPVELTGDDFETGDFSKNPWELGGDAKPEIETEEVYQGDYAVRFGDVGNSGKSTLEIYVEIEQDSKISFYRKTSSQLGHDHLQFYIGDKFAGEWSGDIDWHKVIRELPSGKHTLKWVYEKNASVDEHQDTAWIDDIVISNNIYLGEEINVPDSDFKASILAYLGKNSEATEQFMRKQKGVENEENQYKMKPLSYSDGKVYRNELLDFVEFETVSSGINSIDGIENIENLRFLNLNSNNITDLSPLEDLNDLKKLYLRYNNIDDIGSLESLNNLIDLDAGHNSINDLTPLSNLTKLKYLYLAYNSINDINPLQTLNELEEIYLVENNISNISALENLKKLTWVNICNNEVADISPLASATKLEGLDVGSNGMSDISIVQNFPELWYLSVQGNQIEDLEPIHDLTGIITLYVGNNPLPENELNFLQDWTWLRNLGLESLSLESYDISFIEEYTNIVNLYLGDNQLTDIGFLQELDYLKNLSLNDNQIDDIQPLVDNSGIESGDWIDLSYNKLNIKPGSQDMNNINALINRGVDVDYEPQVVTLVLEIEGSGNVYINDTLYPEGIHKFNMGDYLEGHAVPSAGWEFSHWLLNDSLTVYENPVGQQFWEGLKVKVVFVEQ